MTSMLVQAAANFQLTNRFGDLFTSCHAVTLNKLQPTVVDVPLGRSNNSVIDIVNVSVEKHASLL